MLMEISVKHVIQVLNFALIVNLKLNVLPVQMV